MTEECFCTEHTGANQMVAKNVSYIFQYLSSKVFFVVENFVDEPQLDKLINRDLSAKNECLVGFAEA
ncbi:hypothetical protein ColLi_10543 [Colletotrichum liriopes]|uniref:Uncharacterized protein n=1 Tax=Colletotrichum liriopes TaxID=708192 RepID=A0AA37GVY4_9PEZI|nr:hypothetical protein ColLi_10543 [Colletotrichum liriopes]